MDFHPNTHIHYSQAALEKLEKDPNLDVMEYGCLGYC
ncbi:DUF1450 domain-containing protein, partial [Bacillus sp. B-TM1]